MAEKTRGRSPAGKARPTTTYSETMFRPAPNPCTARATTSTHMLVARPATSRPRANDTAATMNGRTGPRRSDISPATTMPSRLVVRNTEKARP